jgi:hypothetical protein
MATPNNSPGALYSPMTLGVVGEFILFGKALKEGEDRIAAERANPGIFMYPHDEKSPENLCRSRVIKHLRAFGVSINDFDSDGEPIPPKGQQTPPAASANTYTVAFHRWSLKWEVTVDLDETWKPDEIPGDILMLNVELATPVLEDCAATYAEIRRVFSLVKRYFHYHVNDTCGLHVHIGMGKDHMSDEALRRIASVLWVWDCLLTPLHVASRADNTQCPRNRFHSNLAFGMTAEEANEIVARRGRSADGDLSGHKNGTNAVTVAAGLEQIGLCTTAAAVAKLMKVPVFQAPPAYDFFYYTQKGREEKGMPTIECRIGAGSLNPTWIASWARILVRLCDWVVSPTSGADLRTLAVLCHQVETTGYPAAGVTHAILESLGLQEIVEFLKTTTAEQRASRSSSTPSNH